MAKTKRAALSAALTSALVLTACSDQGSAAKTTTTAHSYIDHATGKGVLLSVPLIYRVRPADATQDRAYYVIFRVKSAFVGYDSDGNSKEGQIVVVKDYETKGLGSLGAGHPRGRCYEWDLPKDAAIDKIAVGQSVPFSFRLNATSKQSGRSVMRLSDPAHALTTQFDDQVKSIGCRITYRKNFKK